MRFPHARSRSFPLSFALPHKDKVMIRKAPGGVDVAYRQELLYSSSMRPIVHQVLDREKLLLAELRQALYKLGCVPRHIKQARVDSFTVQPGRKLMPQVLALSATTYKDLTVPRAFAKYPLPQSESMVGGWWRGKAT